MNQAESLGWEHIPAQQYIEKTQHAGRNAYVFSESHDNVYAIVIAYRAYHTSHTSLSAAKKWCERVLLSRAEKSEADQALPAEDLRHLGNITDGKKLLECLRSFRKLAQDHQHIRQLHSEERHMSQIVNWKQIEADKYIDKAVHHGCAAYVLVENDFVYAIVVSGRAYHQEFHSVGYREAQHWCDQILLAGPSKSNSDRAPPAEDADYLHNITDGNELLEGLRLFRKLAQDYQHERAVAADGKYIQFEPTMVLRVNPKEPAMYDETKWDKLVTGGQFYLNGRTAAYFVRVNDQREPEYKVAVLHAEKFVYMNLPAGTSTDDAPKAWVKSVLSAEKAYNMVMHTDIPPMIFASLFTHTAKNTAYTIRTMVRVASEMQKLPGVKLEAALPPVNMEAFFRMENDVAEMREKLKTARATIADQAITISKLERGKL